MNYSLPVSSSRMSVLAGLPSFASNQSLIYCRVNATQLMWAMATSGGWSNADIKYKLIADVYVVLTLCIFGFVGNAVTIAVLRKDPDRAISSTNWLLQTLALVDTVYLAARLNVLYTLAAIYLQSRLDLCCRKKRQGSEMLNPTLFYHLSPALRFFCTAFALCTAIGRLAVCLSVTACCRIKTTQASITKTSLSAPPMTPLLGSLKVCQKLDRAHPDRGRETREREREM